MRPRLTPFVLAVIGAGMLTASDGKGGFYLLGTFDAQMSIPGQMPHVAIGTTDLLLLKVVYP